MYIIELNRAWMKSIGDALSNYRFHVMSIPSVNTLSQKVTLYGYISEFQRRGITLESTDWASLTLLHVHLNVIGIMCSKFHLDDFKTVAV